MAHFAQLDANNIVTAVVCGIIELGDDEQAHIDQWGGVWKRTSYNTRGGVHLLGGTPFRKNYAGEGYRYDADLDAFIAPQPFPSWVMNKDICIWLPPIPYPDDGKYYIWDEETVSWDLF